MKTKGSLPRSQDSATDFYPDLDASSTQVSTLP